jgi:PAS domain S-box-containing protein
MAAGPVVARERLEAELAASNDRMRAVLHAALDCVVAIDADGRVIEFNPAAEHCFGYTAREALGREMAELIVPPAQRERHRAGLARYLADGSTTILDRRIEITAQRAGGEQFPVELTITRTALPGPPVFVGYLRDISDRRRDEAELRASRARIIAAADAARRRIERDLHDGAQQLLVALGLTLRLARARVEADPPSAAALLDEAIDELSAATEQLRELARGIHPAVLTEGGLESAIVGLVGRIAVPVTLTATIERFPAQIEATAYYVVAEALTNVMRHAGGRRAEVSVVRRGPALMVEVRDHGRGGATVDGGSGLRGLADRVAAVSGQFSIDSPAGGGTTLRAELPCAS